jgi:hypothetical protein
MINMDLLRRIERAIPVPSQRFVVHRDILVCQMEYVERDSPFKWALVQTRLGMEEAVSNTAVCKLQTKGTALELTFLKLQSPSILPCANHSRQGVIVVGQAVAAAQEQTLFIWGSLRKPVPSHLQPSRRHHRPQVQPKGGKVPHQYR